MYGVYTSTAADPVLVCRFRLRERDVTLYSAPHFAYEPANTAKRAFLYFDKGHLLHSATLECYRRKPRSRQ